MKYKIKNISKTIQKRSGKVFKAKQELTFNLSKHQLFLFETNRNFELTCLETVQEEVAVKKEEVEEVVIKDASQEITYVCPHCNHAPFQSEHWFKVHLKKCEDKQKKGDK